jgi:beta-lactam-binding protein with PASTA domain
VLVAVIVALLLAGGIYAFEFASGNGGNISVPNVDGQTLQQARAEIVQAGLVVGPVKYQSSSSVPANNVISTNPSNGTNVSKHASVSLLVSSGLGTKVVPGVVGKQQAAAESALSAAGFGFSTTPKASSEPSGTVLSQSPNGGQRAAPGTQVQLTVSEGGSSVPDVIGMTQANATTTLQGAGFTVTPVTGNAPPGTAPGTVYQTSPNPNALAAPGATITIFVAPGSTSTSPPPSTSPPAQSSSPPPTDSPSPTTTPLPTTAP